MMVGHFPGGVRQPDLLVKKTQGHFGGLLILVVDPATVQNEVSFKYTVRIIPVYLSHVTCILA